MGSTGSGASLLQALQQRAAVWKHLHQRQEQVQEPSRLRMLTLRCGAIAILCAALGTSAIAQSKDVLIFGGDGHKEFLGCLTCDEFATDSVWNEFSSYGWSNSFAVWNPFGQYKNPYSSYSACNEYASDPPVLVDRTGGFYGRLTINTYVPKSICSVIGNERVCRALKVMCASD